MSFETPLLAFSVKPLGPSNWRVRIDVPKGDENTYGTKGLKASVIAVLRYKIATHQQSALPHIVRPEHFGAGGQAVFRGAVEHIQNAWCRDGGRGAACGVLGSLTGVFASDTGHIEFLPNQLPADRVEFSVDAGGPEPILLRRLEHLKALLDFVLRGINAEALLARLASVRRGDPPTYASDAAAPDETASSPKSGDGILADLAALGVSAAAPLTPELVRAMGDCMAIGSATLQWDILGYHGVPPDAVSVELVPTGGLKLPAPVSAALATHPLPTGADNRPKVGLLRWAPPVLDISSRTQFTLGRYDYHTVVSYHRARTALHQGLLDGTLELTELVMPIGVSPVVVTRDEQLVLAKRGEHLYSNKGNWEISASEWIDPDQDVNGGTSMVGHAVLRALQEPDELNLARVVSETRLYAISVDWDVMAQTIHALVSLDKSAASARPYLPRGGEHSEYDMIPFTIDRCLPLIVTGEHAVERRPASRGKICDIHRVALLGALYCRFGIDQVERRLAEWVQTTRAKRRPG